MRQELCANPSSKAVRLSKPKVPGNFDFDFDPEPGTSDWNIWVDWSLKAFAKLRDYHEKQEKSVLDIEEKLLLSEEECKTLKQEVNALVINNVLLLLLSLSLSVVCLYCIRY